MRKTKYLFLLFVMLPSAFAVEIHQVLYDPVNSEAGGEAVELYNPDDYDANLDGWTIATSASDQDITFPKNATMMPHSYFLVSDNGWGAQKDNLGWKDADYEETMTLPNTNSGIMLKNKNGIVIDAVGWGDPAKIKSGLYSGNPSKGVTEGMALVRISSSGDNSRDFVEQAPNFLDEKSVLVNVAVEDFAPKIMNFSILEDDYADSGVQITPIAGKTRNITIFANIESAKSPYADFQGKIIALSKTNATVYNAMIPLAYSLPPRNYSIKVYSGDSSSTIDFTYLPLKKFKVKPNTMTFKAGKGQTADAGKITIINLGNVQLTLTVSSAGLNSKNSTISYDNFLANIDGKKDKMLGKKIQLLPGAEKEMLFSIMIPEDAVKDNYTTILRFLSS